VVLDPAGERGTGPFLPGFNRVFDRATRAYGPFHERRDPALRADAIAARLRRRFQREIPEAQVNVFGAPAVDGLGTAGGFKLMVEATGAVNFDALQAQRVVESRPSPADRAPGGPPEKAQAEAYLGRVAARVREQGVPVRTRVVVARHAVEAIREEAAAQASDLIALATHGRGGLRRLQGSSTGPAPPPTRRAKARHRAGVPATQPAR
jgi:hypothetical protein